jgi:hypothetical protein
VFGTVGLTSLFLFPLVAGAGMVMLGASAAFGPTLLLMLPFMLARAG